MGCFVPAVGVCLLPVNLLHWAAMLYGLGSSAMFLWVNLRGYAEGVSPAVLGGVIVGLQFVLFLTFKLKFLELLDQGEPEGL